MQLGDDPGDLVEGLGILVCVGQEARQLTYRKGHSGSGSGNTHQSACQRHACIDHAVDKAGCRIGDGGKEGSLQGASGKTIVDFIELLHALCLVGKCLHHLLVANHFIDQCRLLSPHLRLLPEHAVGAAGNEPGNEQG